jgi:hypothetical protein
MTKSYRKCGAPIHRCGECGTAVAPSRVRSGDNCPRHPDAEPMPGGCERRLAVGAVRCRWHSGTQPNVVAKQAERVIEAQVQSLLKVEGSEPVSNPYEALAKLLGEVVQVKDAFGEKVAELQSLTVEDQLGREDVRALLAAYERALDRCGRFLVDASRLNLDHHLIAIAKGISERDSRLLVDALERVVNAFVAPSQRKQFNRAIAQQFRSLDQPREMWPDPADLAPPRLLDVPPEPPPDPPERPTPLALNPGPSEPPAPVERPAEREVITPEVVEPEVVIQRAHPARSTFTPTSRNGIY